MRTLLVHALLACAGLTLAWRLSTAEVDEDGARLDIELFACSELKLAEYTAQGRTLKIEQRSAEGASFYWLTVTPKNPEQGASQGSPEAREPSYYLLDDDEDAKAWLAGFSPMKATRSLGEVDEEVRGELGLGEEADELRLECSGGEATFRIGESTYGAQGTRYLQRKEGGEVYLVPRAFVSSIAQADSQLAKRTLHTFPSTDVDTLVVAVEGKTITLLQRDRHNAQAAVWVDAETPEQRNDLFGNWMSRVEALSVREYLPLEREPGEELEGSAAETVLELTYRGEGGTELGTLRVARAEDPKNPAVPHYYARSEETRSWVTVPYSVARDVESNARMVLGLDPLTEPETQSAPNGSSGEAPGQTAEPASAAASSAPPLPAHPRIPPNLPLGPR